MLRNRFHGTTKAPPGSSERGPDGQPHLPTLVPPDPRTHTLWPPYKFCPGARRGASQVRTRAAVTGRVSSLAADPGARRARFPPRRRQMCPTARGPTASEMASVASRSGRSKPAATCPGLYCRTLCWDGNRCLIRSAVICRALSRPPTRPGRRRAPAVKDEAAFVGLISNPNKTSKNAGGRCERSLRKPW